MSARSVGTAAIHSCDTACVPIGGIRGDLPPGGGPVTAALSRDEWALASHAHHCAKSD